MVQSYLGIKPKESPRRAAQTDDEVAQVLQTLLGAPGVVFK